MNDVRDFKPENLQGKPDVRREAKRPLPVPQATEPEPLDYRGSRAMLPKERPSALPEPVMPWESPAKAGVQSGASGSVARTPVLPGAPRILSGQLRVQLHIDRPRIQLRAEIAGRNAAHIVRQMRMLAAREVGIRGKLKVWTMSNLEFAREVIRRHNLVEEMSLPLPASCEAFLLLWEENGFATITLEDAVT